MGFPQDGVDLARDHAEPLHARDLVGARRPGAVIKGVALGANLINCEPCPLAACLDGVHQVVNVLVATGVHGGNAEAALDDPLENVPRHRAGSEGASLRSFAAAFTPLLPPSRNLIDAHAAAAGSAPGRRQPQVIAAMTLHSGDHAQRLHIPGRPRVGIGEARRHLAALIEIVQCNQIVIRIRRGAVGGDAVAGPQFHLRLEELRQLRRLAFQHGVWVDGAAQVAGALGNIAARLVAHAAAPAGLVEIDVGMHGAELLDRQRVHARADKSILDGNRILRRQIVEPLLGNALAEHLLHVGGPLVVRPPVENHSHPLAGLGLRQGFAEDGLEFHQLLFRRDVGHPP